MYVLYIHGRWEVSAALGTCSLPTGKRYVGIPKPAARVVAGASLAAVMKV